MTTPVYVTLLPRAVLLDIAGPAEAFRIAEKLRPGSFSLHYVSPQPDLESGSGLHLARLAPLPASLPGHALVLVPGVVGASVDWTDAATLALLAWLARVRQDGDPGGPVFLCVCAGALLAARAGLLDGRDCTTHHGCLAALTELAPGARVHDNRIFVEDGNLCTSAGITAGIDLALHRIALQCGAPLAAEVAREMVVYLRRSGDDPALSAWLDHRNHLHPGVHRVQDAIVRAPAQSWRIDELAALAHTSARHLGRLFREHAGCTPHDYLTRVRLALARELIHDSRESLERVAEKAGFGSAHHLRRVWRQHEGLPPGRSRHARVAAPD
ncbi:Transcriptional regulator, AraC family [plant metagenome]|uniref:Transcriptional regulator, AraC family n=1 Tax=plant metagenome TaxID=1297885 RepID=A0A484U9A7_9ZZZZ